MRRLLNNTGDTIVEVLISIAAVSMVLSGAYITTNRTTRNARQSEERIEALKLVESQFEQLKVLAKDPSQPVYTANPTINTATSLFCTTATGLTPFTTGTLPSLDTDDFSTYPANCKLLMGATTVNIAIKRNPSSVNSNEFRVTARYPNAIGQGNDEVVMYYRLYQ